MSIVNIRIIQIITVFLLLILPLTPGIPVLAQDGEQPVVYAVLFFSQTCPHCHQVISEDIPPLIEQYGDQLRIILVDVTTEQGNAFYQEVVNVFEIPDNRLGVPTLVIDDIVLVGSREIPELLPGLVEQGLKKGGIPFPNLPNLFTAAEAAGLFADPEVEPTEESAAATEQIFTEEETAAEIPSAVPAEEDPPATDSALTSDPEISSIVFSEGGTPWERFMRDPVGNGIATVVLLVMVISIIAIIVFVLNPERWKLADWPTWVIPVLVILGLFVAFYLSYVEVTNTTAICGPVGDCNTVQESRYAKLFGVLHIGVLGTIGYVLIGFAWVMSKFGPKSLRNNAWLALWGMAVFGTAFSIYLTFLEPFVIGATCAWCVSSAIIMTLLLWASTPAMLGQLIFDESKFEEELN